MSAAISVRVIDHGVGSLYLPSGNSAGIQLAFSFSFIQFGYLHRLVLSTFRGNLPSSDKPFWKSSTDILRGVSSRWF